MTDMPRPARWDIFCRVVDHFGDAGVCMRLSRQLVAEHGFLVTLWIDRPETLAGMVANFVPSLATQKLDGVNVRRWTDPLPEVTPADVVVNAFVAGLPGAYVDAMALRPEGAPFWIELEYLSPDPAFDAHHLKPSPHPRLPLARTYWVPGFSAISGGVLRECDLIERRNRFQTTASAQDAFCEFLKLAAPRSTALRVSVFSYPQAPARALALVMREGPVDVLCAVPEGDPFGDHARNQSGRLTVTVYPFLRHDDFDRLLWSCDVNFVRGEDSLVRALWAGRPLVWLLYPQAPEVLDVKLGAFLDWYTEGLERRTSVAYRRMTLAWNGRAGTGNDSAMTDVRGNTRAPAGGDERPQWRFADAWRDFVAAQPALREHATRLAERRATAPDLVSRLVKYIETCL